MDVQANKKALYRAKLKEVKAEKRIESPLVRYNENDQPVCRVCDFVLKSVSSWQAHQVSAKHREAIKNATAKAAAATRVNSVKPQSAVEVPKPKPEHSVESHKRPEPATAQSSSLLPSDFFDKRETKRQKDGIADAKPSESESKKNVLRYAQNQMMDALAIENTNDNVSGAIAVETRNDEFQPSKQVHGALPEGFFDNKDADLRARGITPVKLDIKDEYKEYEKSIQEDLKEVDNRLEEEEYDAAETIEEAESVEQKTCKERVEMLKRKKMELMAAWSAKRSKVSKVVAKESSLDESSDEDSDDDFSVDWRAKHL